MNKSAWSHAHFPSMADASSRAERYLSCSSRTPPRAARHDDLRRRVTIGRSSY